MQIHLVDVLGIIKLLIALLLAIIGAFLMALQQPDRLVNFEDEVTAPFLPVVLPPPTAKSRYVSLRWRLLVPLVLVVLVIATSGAYLISDKLTRGYDEKEANDLRSASQKVAAQALQFGDYHHREMFRMINTRGVRENIAGRDAERLHTLLEPNALLADLDLVIVTTADGQEIIGLQRTLVGDPGNEAVDYAVADETDLSSIAILEEVLENKLPYANGITRSGQGLMILSAEPIYSPADQIMGVIVVGTRLDHILAQLSGGVELAAFGGDGKLLNTTLPDDEDILSQLPLKSDAIDKIFDAPDRVPTERLSLGQQRYQVAYFPFKIDSEPVGVLGVYRLSTTPFATEAARNLFRITVSLLAAGAVIITYLGLARIIERTEQVRLTAEALASGNDNARTRIPSSDEIGELASALDRYADSVQNRSDHLMTYLQRQQQESARLTAVVENIPDGLVILDLEGRILMMNSAARKLIGGISSWRKTNLNQLTAVTTERLGPALAPGIYAIGDPTRISHGEKMLQAQTAVVMSVAGKQLGLVVTLRDISIDVEREQRYEALLEELSREVQLPISHVAQDAALTATNQPGAVASGSLLEFARQIARNARSMQRILTELRDVNTFNPQDVERGQLPILVSNLLWQIAAQWKPAANTARIDIVIVNPADVCYVLGDERRLRWAIGNVVDNAIKYSLPGTTLTISGGETVEGYAHVQVIDQGVGISAEDLPHIFKRFYRGQPPLLHAQNRMPPGTGQGLFLAQKVIEAHGGQIVIESQPEQGTTVNFWLPLTAPVTLEMPMEQASSSAPESPEIASQVQLVEGDSVTFE